MLKSDLLDVLNKNLAWFENSGIMVPENGSWGVAERIFNVTDAALRKQVHESFGAFTDFGSYSIIESRRADCNFEAALMYLLSAKISGCSKQRQIGENLLAFLYNRSGLLNRGAMGGLAPIDTWNWSHTCWIRNLWFDDNAWALAVPILISRFAPELEEKFEMRKHAAGLAKELASGFARAHYCDISSFSADCYDPCGVWKGRPFLPHWGGLVCMALSLAAEDGLLAENDQHIIEVYHEYLASSIDDFNASELAYALMSSSVGAKVFGKEIYYRVADMAAERILRRMQTSGNIPAEHYEAPQGPHLVDTIYTVNWMLLALQNYAVLRDTVENRTAFKKVLDLICSIQDKDESSLFNGCWRGMYDLESGSWGGGDSYEGGCGSIYSGWTNAPISIAICGELLGKNIFMEKSI